MDFIPYIVDQKEKLHSPEYVRHLWNEIEENQMEEDINSNCLNDFNNHLPILMDEFWKLAVEKLDKSLELEEIDTELKQYLLVLVYHSITQNQEDSTLPCGLYAAEVYLSLLTKNEEEYYKTKLYKTTLTTLQTALEIVPDQFTQSVIYKLKVFSTRSRFNNDGLEVTLATLLQIILLKTRKSQQFEHFEPEPSSDYQALVSLKSLMEKETISERKFLIISYMLNGLRHQSSIYLPDFNMVQRNLRGLLYSLHGKFKEDGYKSFLNSFINVWKHQDFVYFDEAILIMNELKEKEYQTLIEILLKMMTTKTSHRNLFKLSHVLMYRPPKFKNMDKIKVTNKIVITNILMNCLSPKDDISHAAVDVLSESLTSSEFDKEFIKEPMKEILGCQSPKVDLNVPTLLNGLKTLLSKKWNNHWKNLHVATLIFSVILYSDQDYPATYQEVFELIGEVASPFDLKPLLPLIAQIFDVLTKKQCYYSAFQLLKLIFKMALHQMASASDFVKFLYIAMLGTKITKNATISSDLLINYIVSADFNFTEFFQKCHNLGLIRVDHITKLMSDLSATTECDLKLVSSIIHLVGFKDTSLIPEYINKNFINARNNNGLTYILCIYNKMLKSFSSTMQASQNLKNNEIMVSFVKYHLVNQTFRWNCVPNAFALLVTLGEFMTLDYVFDNLKDEYDRRVGSLAVGVFLPLLYFSQLVVFGKKLPSRQNMEKVVNILVLSSQETHRRSPEFNPKLYIAALTLYTNITVVTPSMVEDCMKYLEHGLNCPITTVKLASLNLYFDVCNLLTHNFENLITYLFNELVHGNDIFKKTCLLKIDRLIRDDYLKLELDQFIALVSILGDRNLNLSDYLKQLFMESFLVTNACVVVRFFMPFLIQINGYKRHPLYSVSDSEYDLILAVQRNIFNRNKIYTLLFVNLPVKAKFNILNILAKQILEELINGNLKPDDGFWDMIKDSIFIFKLLTPSSNETGHSFYKKVLNSIAKYLIQAGDCPDKELLHPEYQKEIVFDSQILMKLLFFNEGGIVQGELKSVLVDTIMHWTNFLIPNLIQAIHHDRLDLKTPYIKFEKFYKTYQSELNA